MTGSSDFPLSVNEYSIRTGYSEYTVRVTIASFSNNLSRSESNRPLTGKFVSISEKRFGPFKSSNKMRPTQRLLMISIAFSKREHKLFSIMINPFFILAHKIMKLQKITSQIVYHNRIMV